MPTLEFFFDCSSPWTYLAFENVQRLAENHELILVWRPILVGGVFNAVNPSIYDSRANPVPAKARHQAKDLQDCARHCGVTVRWPPPVFPVNSVKAMRGAFVALEHGRLPRYARLVFQAYWRDGQDISQDAVLRATAAAAGLDGTEFLAKIQDRRYKDKLRAATDELILRGGFGSPTLFLNGDDMYFGNDRLPLIEARLASLAPG